VQAFDPDFGDPGHIAHMAAIVLPLVLDRRKWIRRRTDKIRLASETVIQWEVQLEFSIPDICAWIGEEVWLTRIPLPIALHAKTIVTRLRMTDESGTEYSMLTTIEDRQVVLKMLDTQAAIALGVPGVDSTIAQLIADVVDEDDASGSARKRLEATASGSKLAQDEAFSAMLGEVDSHFIMMVLVDYEIGVPWILHLTYEEHLRRSPEGFRLPWVSPGPLQTPALPLGMADSYHAEFEAPPGLEFSAGTDVEWHISTARQRSRRVLTSFVAVHAAGADRGAWARIRAAWIPLSKGLPRVAQYVSWATFSFFAIAMILRVWPGLKPTANSAAASVLLAIPAIYALLVVQPGQHPVTGQYTAGPRAVIAAAGAMALLGAATLTIQFPPPPEPMVNAGFGWRSVSWLAITLALAILVWIATRWRHQGGAAMPNA
jgi:hypothetical protein